MIDEMTARRKKETGRVTRILLVFQTEGSGERPAYLLGAGVWEVRNDAPRGPSGRDAIGRCQGVKGEWRTTTIVLSA